MLIVMPSQSSSSYECDGCGHHASFHTMENKVEDEIRKRWEVEAAERRKEEEEERDAQKRPRKRVRAIEFGNGDDEAVPMTGAKKAWREAPRGRAKAKGKSVGEDRLIELD
jgi:RPA family protein